MKHYLLLCLVLPVCILATDFSDDFETLSPGDDLNSSVNWLHPTLGGNFVAADESGNTVIESVWNSNDFITYLCLGASAVSDGAVSADIKFSGSDAVSGIIARVDLVSQECYMAGIYPAAPPLGATVIAYVDGNGEYQLLANEFFYPMNEDTWYSMSFEVTGTNPVQLKLSLDGNVVSTVQENLYNLGAGATGIIAGYDSSEPVFTIDNYDVDDYSVALSRITFAAVKTLFR